MTKCDCGTVKPYNVLGIVVGKTTHCGCLTNRSKPIEDLTGRKFNNLTCIRYLGGSNWECVCDCGKNTVISSYRVSSGETKSCGCIKSCAISKARTTHGESQSTRLYRIWASMITRCTNPNRKHFHRYGGRGISVCGEWRAYLTFKSWALSNGYRDDLQLDRTNNDGNYEPGNCRWATSVQNCNNQSKTRWVTLGDSKMPRAVFARTFGIKYSFVRKHDENGVSGEQIIDEWRSLQ